MARRRYIKRPVELSIVIPVYNEQANLPALWEALTDVLRRELPEARTEFLFVDDGSRDDSAAVIQAFPAAENTRVRLIRFSRNFGYQAALTAGLDHAGGDAVITMDSDLQHPPDLLPRLVEQWRAGHHIVHARRERQEDGFVKRLSSRLYAGVMARTSDVHIERNISDYRLLDRRVVDELKRMGEHARFLRGMISWIGFKQTFIEYTQPDRHAGRTAWTWSGLTRLAIDGLLGYSRVPLRLALWLGVLSITLATVFFLYICYRHFLAGQHYQLYKWINVITFGFIGLQFILLWILGEYIGRIYSEVRKRPLYVVMENLEVGPGDVERRPHPPVGGEREK